MRTSISELGTKGFVALPYPLYLEQYVRRATKLWREFCALPESVKMTIPYSSNSAGVGYEYKVGEGNQADRKEIFDITDAGIGWLMRYVESIEEPIVRNFVETTIVLTKMVVAPIFDFAHQTEEFFQISGFVREVVESQSAFFIRFIHYPGGRVIDEEIATAHADQSGFTLHLHESAPGLQCLTYDGQWISMPVSDGATVIIPAMQLQLRSEGKLRALCHRVVATSETAEVGRYSAVCFVQLKGTPKYDKEKHGRLQERDPGFNYALSHEEFAKLFK